MVLEKKMKMGKVYNNVNNRTDNEQSLLFINTYSWTLLFTRVTYII